MIAIALAITLVVAGCIDVPDAIGQRSDLDASHHALAPGPFYDDWHDLEDLQAHVDELAAVDHVGLIELGRSVEGRPIRALEIASPGAPADRPTVLVTGLQHAREWVAGASALYIAERLADGLDVDPEVDAVLADWRVLVVPVANPDGYRYSWTTDRMWRKNRRPLPEGQFGVDLNRNWGEAWGQTPGASDRPGSPNYHGPAAFSEPETMALRDLVRDRPAIIRHLDLHCTGQLVLTPWAHTAMPSPHAARLLQAAEAAVIALQGVHGAVYDAGSFHDRLYVASGTAIDWTHAEGLDSYLFELRDRGQYGFLLPAEQLRPTAEEAWAGFVALVAAE